MPRRLDYINFLPQALLMYNIFSRLPVKSLGRCKCVLKSWNSLISDSHFIKNHLTKTSNDDNTKFICISLQPNPGFLYSLHLDNNPPSSDGFASKLNFVCSNTWSRIWGSCNGLILAEDGRTWTSMFLLNPTTLEFKILPLLRHGCQNTCVFGFGYDSSSDDYAVVAISYRKYGSKKDARVYVYMLKTNQWNKLGLSPYDHKFNHPAAGIFVRGSLIWLAKNVNDSSCLISAFNIATKEFSEVPNGNFNIGFEVSGLGILNGCLCLINIDSSLPVLWVMKEYGVVESWIKLSIDTTDLFCDMPIHVRKDNIVVVQLPFVLVVTSAEEFKVYEYEFGNSQHKFIAGMFCIDSLVSLNNKDGNQKKNRLRR